MRNRILVLVALVLASPAHASDAGDVRDFFDEFAEHADDFDLKLADLYRDDARIVTLRDGTETLEMSGAELKAALPRMMPSAKLRGDTDSYSDIAVAPLGTGYRVTATRVPAAKCRPDPNFHLDVAKFDSEWRITAEYREAVSLSECPPSKALARSLAKIRKGILEHLPADLNRDTRLEAVEVVGSALIYTQRLHTLAAADLEPLTIRQVLYRLAMQSSCGAPELKALIDEGATLRFATLDREGVRIANVDVTTGACPEPVVPSP